MSKLLLSLLFATLSCFGYAQDDLIVVSCAYGELGTAIAKKLASENNLVLAGRNPAKLKALQEELSSHYPHTYEIAQFDYLDHASFKNALSPWKGNISGLVVITPRPAFGRDLLQGEAEWLRLFQSTFIGPVELINETIPCLTSHGKIVILAGTTSVQYLPEYGPTCIVRRMWTTYAKALAHQLGAKGICVNTLSPGVVLTPFHTERIATKAERNQVDFEAQMEQEVAHIPLGRHADPREIAQSVKFLLSRDSDFITGVNLVIDGGTTVSYQ